MNTALWTVQILLGTMMISLGIMKTFLPVKKLTTLSWTTRSSENRIRFVGFSELLIGLGLILPQATGITPRLTSLAAFALCIIMALAVGEHMRNNEKNEIGKNIFILLLAAFVAVGRFIPLESY
jgi:hypothetical protein